MKNMNPDIETLIDGLELEFKNHEKFQNMSSQVIREFALNVIRYEITKQIVK